MPRVATREMYLHKRAKKRKWLNLLENNNNCNLEDKTCLFWKLRLNFQNYKID